MIGGAKNQTCKLGTLIMVTEAQTSAIGILNILVALHLSRVLYKSTLFMQNKPNLLDSQMNIISVLTRGYENKSNWTLGENKPNSNPIQSQSNPIKPNFKAKQTQTNPIKPNFRPNSTNSSPGIRPECPMLFLQLNCPADLSIITIGLLPGYCSTHPNTIS